MFLSGTDTLKVEGPVEFDGRRASSRAIDLPRLIDVTLALGLLLFTLPLMLVVATAIKIQDGGPVLFGHTRIGRGGRTFRCWKFRSMVVDAEERLAALLACDPAARAEWDADHKLRRDPRVTALGRFIRLTSIDELPQVLNVLAGEMSLVGPRPIVVAEVPRYGRWYRHYTAVRPGITGLWQVSGRNDVDYRTRVAMDVLFAKTQCSKRYLWILAMTVPAVAKRTGVY